MKTLSLAMASVVWLCVFLYVGSASTAQDAEQDSARGGVDQSGQVDAAPDLRSQHGIFTGDVKLVLYVRDVRKSVDFYRGALGFEFHSYHDYTNNKSVTEWNETEPPIYAEMSAGRQKFGLHLPQSAYDQRCVGRGRVYFRVKDVDAHYRRVKAWGIDADPLCDTDWMRMFSVTDPDGYKITFGATRAGVHKIDPW